jgi:hypothetical protein
LKEGCSAQRGKRKSQILVIPGTPKESIGVSLRGATSTHGTETLPV